MKKYYKNIAIGLILAGFCVPSLTSAAEFDPDYLISDTEMRDYRSMDLGSIQRFLDKREGTLSDYICVDKQGKFKTAAQTFNETSNRWRINPKYLLILVQKEMSLLTDDTPKQTQYDWATGYGCFDGEACNKRWEGFYKQVNSAAAQFDYYMTNINEFTYRPGKTYAIDKEKVTPKNIATAGLYNYTPHIHGNKLFWNLWNKYFGKKWPDGAVLRDQDNLKTFLIAGGQKREITSKSILLSLYDPAKIVDVATADLSYYEDGAPVKYHNFSILQDSRNNLYMIVGAQKRKFESREIFNKLGFNEDEMIKVSTSELKLYEDGSKITKNTLHPTGTLVQDEKTEEIFYLINGRKKLVATDEVLEFNFPGMPIESIAHTSMDRYRSSNPVTLPDGELIKSKLVNTVYVISNGKRLPIFNGDIFRSMNYKWNNVMIVSDDTLDVHPLGQTITGDW